MSFEFYYTLALLLLLTVLLVKEIVRTEIAIFGTLILLMLANIVTVDEAFSGFSNRGMLTIGLLFVVAAAFQTTGVLSSVVANMIGGAQLSITKKLLRLLIPVSVLSAFLNNTTIVAVLIPAIRQWTQRNNEAVSKYLIPLSYAAILGGTCTLIGTSTNLIIHGLMLDHADTGFSFFELSLFGIPATVAGLLYLVTIGHRLLPEHYSGSAAIKSRGREFVAGLKITSDYKYIGASIEDAGLRHLKGLYLFQIERGNELLLPVKPDEALREGDRLFFTGLPITIVELQKTPGLILLEDAEIDLKNYDSDQYKIYEAVVSSSSSLIGKNVRESNFRERFNAVILAIHRSGERIEKKVGDIVLQQGDTLLLLSSKAFHESWYNSTEFSLIARSDEIDSKPRWQALVVASTFLLMLLFAILGWLPMILAVSIAAVVPILTKAVSGERVVKEVNWRILLIIASSFGIAKGIENSGVGAYIADVLIVSLRTFGPLAVLSGVYLLTTLYTNIITNNTAAVLLFPVALAAATAMNAQLHPFAIAVAIGASSSFATPLSYQTNLMVQSIGQYSFKDFLRVGIPMQLIIGVVTILMLFVLYF